MVRNAGGLPRSVVNAALRGVGERCSTVRETCCSLTMDAISLRWGLDGMGPGATKNMLTSAGGCDGGGPAGPPVAVACPCEAGAECDWSGWAGCCRERRRPGRCTAGGRGGTG